MLLRQALGNVEVLVIRRHERLAFMGGLWVFPGGALSDADTSPAAFACVPASLRQGCHLLKDLNGRRLEAPQSIGLAIAACRETFEETGILLARTAADAEPDAGQLQRLHAERHALGAAPHLFATLLAQEHLLLEIRHLVYWAHWITPSTVARRFDTRFFAIEAPVSQSVTLDHAEAVDYAWMTPAALLAAAAAGAMALSPPTLYNLMALEAGLEEHGSLHATLTHATRREIVAVLPKIRRDSALLMLLPWDPEYLEIPGENAPQQIAYPHWLRALPSRVMQER